MIKIQDMDFSYSSSDLFKDFFLTMTSRQFTAILGPNGSGKTTLLKLLLGLLSPAKGTLYWENSELSTLGSRQRSAIMAYVPQSLESSYDYSIKETVMMGRYPHLGSWQKEGDEDRKIVDRAMDIMEITHLKNRSIHTVSGERGKEHL
jgi:iron complex transport system ATP-binding protein